MSVQDARARFRGRVDSVMRGLASSSLRLSTPGGVVVGFTSAALVALIDFSGAPDSPFILPLTLVVVAIGWFSTSVATAIVVVGGALLWSVEHGLRANTPLAWEVVFFLSRSLSLAILGMLAHELRHVVRAERNRALRDELTGLLNRRGFFEIAVHEIARSQRDDTPFAVAMLDLDGLKQINDSLGHTAGDSALVRFASHARGRVRSSDVLARLGGDEFAIVINGDREAVEAVLGEVLAVPEIDGQPDVRVSAGAVIYLRAPVSLDEALKRADELMYAAKEAGGGYRLADADAGVVA